MVNIQFNYSTLIILYLHFFYVNNYPEVQVLSHVSEESSHHGGQMNDVCRTMSLEGRSRLFSAPKAAHVNIFTMHVTQMDNKQ